MIDSNSFGIDQSEIQSIREQMQAAVDGGFVSGNIILVGNSLRPTGIFYFASTLTREQAPEISFFKVQMLVES